MAKQDDNNNLPFDIEKLKTDPTYWMRLATPLENSDKMTCAFLGKENPFAKNDGQAMEKVQKLADEGKLFVREEGRSRHFRKVEKDGDSLKLGEMKDAPLDGPYDFVLGLLLRASQGYFSSLGLDRISNWFGKRVERYDSYREQSARYKAEYKALPKEKKDELNKLRKQEKAAEKLQKRMEKLQKLLESTQKELETAQQELDEVWNGDTKGKENEPTPQQTQPTTEQTPPTTEQTPPTTEQTPPTTEQTPPTTEQTPPTTEQTPPTTEQTPPTTEQTPPTNTNVADGLPEFQLIVGGKEYNNKNIHMAPEDVKRMVKLLEEIGKQLESQQATQNNAENLLDFSNPVNAPVNNELPFVDFTRNQDGNLIDDNIPVNAPVNNELPFVDFTRNQDGNLIDDNIPVNAPVNNELPFVDFTGNQDGNLIDDNIPVNAPVNNELPFVDLTGNQDGNQINNDVPVNVVDNNDIPAVDPTVPQEQNAEPVVQEPEHEEVVQEIQPEVRVEQPPEVTVPQVEQPEIEPDNVDIQQRPEDQAQQQPGQNERLAEEKANIESARNWKDRIANALFSHAEGQDIKEEYEEIKDNPQVSRNMLMSAAMGILANVANINGGPENSQKMIDALLSGQSLGSEHDASIHGAYAAAKNAWQEHGEGQSQGLKDLLKDSVCELSKQASRETALSDRLVMVGKMISACNDIAKECGLSLGLDPEEMRAAQGAVELAKMAVKYHDARQYLSGEPKDLSSGKGAEALRDLLVGRALDAMLWEEDKAVGEIAVTQNLVGAGVWSNENLAQMANNSTVRKNITQDIVSSILENPDGMTSHMTGANIIKEMIQGSVQQQNGNAVDMQLQRQANPMDMQATAPM